MKKILILFFSGLAVAASAQPAPQIPQMAPPPAVPPDSLDTPASPANSQSSDAPIEASLPVPGDAPAPTPGAASAIPDPELPVPPLGVEQAIIMAPESRVLQVVMDDRRILRVPTHPSVNTTCIFPEMIAGLDGAGFTQNPNETSGEFLISFTPGSTYFTITPVGEAARRNLNVIVAGKCYVVEPYPVASYTLAAAAVQFARQAPNLYRSKAGGDQAEAGEFDATGPAARKSASAPRPQFDGAGAGKLISLLDVLKLMSGLQGGELDAALKVMPHIQLGIHGGARDIRDCGDFTLRVDRVLRNNRIDALAFEVTLKSKAQRTLYIDPESFGVRVGDQLHSQVVVDFHPTVPKGKEVKAYFAIINSPDGSPNYLSVDNQFNATAEGSLNLLSALEPALPSGDAEDYDDDSKALKPVLHSSAAKPVPRAIPVEPKKEERAAEKIVTTPLFPALPAASAAKPANKPASKSSEKVGLPTTKAQAQAPLKVQAKVRERIAALLGVGDQHSKSRKADDFIPKAQPVRRPMPLVSDQQAPPIDGGDHHHRPPLVAAAGNPDGQLRTEVQESESSKPLNSGGSSSSSDSEAKEKEGK